MVQHYDLTAPPTGIFVHSLPFCTTSISGPLTPLGMKMKWLYYIVGLVRTGWHTEDRFLSCLLVGWTLTFGSLILYVSSKLLTLEIATRQLEGFRLSQREAVERQDACLHFLKPVPGMEENAKAKTHLVQTLVS